MFKQMSKMFKQMSKMFKQMSKMFKQMSKMFKQMQWFLKAVPLFFVYNEWRTRPRGYKKIFKLNSTEHEIYHSHKC